jgi:hypothetical protein
MITSTTPDLAAIEGTRAAVIYDTIQDLLEMKLPEVLLRELCKVVEKLTDSAYKEGYEDGQWS